MEFVELDKNRIIEKNSLFYKNYCYLPHNYSSSKLTNCLDLVFVPLVGFTEKKQRVGFGKGFYDNFFNKIPEEKHNLDFEFNISKPWNRIIENKKVNLV